MSLAKRYNPSEAEPRLQAFWQEKGFYHFSDADDQPVYSIDTPPATVSGHLHLGHVYSYSHPDFMARFWRMNGYNVFYPMGFDDNGLPTERLVERRLGITAAQVGRQVFIEKCLEVGVEAEKNYQALWQRLGLSIDWRHTYRTIDTLSRKTSQYSFIDLHKKGLVYRREAPTIWCPECRTAIAQAELDDKDFDSEYVTLPFCLDQGGESLQIATTRPELLPACMAVFVHPEDARFQGWIGKMVIVPLFGQAVPVLADAGADPQKGTGAVMCCTFGDTTDVAWWYSHKLLLVQSIGRDGRMTAAAGVLEGLTISEARQQVKLMLVDQGLIEGRQPTTHSVRVHERCDTPVEYIITQQWFIRVMDHRQELLRQGEKVEWRPIQMSSRYQAWVENLSWDWCISRQRYFGVPFPLWYCKGCGEVILADETRLPVDPTVQEPSHPCSCGSTEFIPEEDVFDTWATSSLTPQIVGRWLEDPEFYRRVFPFSLRPQAHEIIRTWAFYTIVKSYYHFDSLPWKEVLISGWGLAGEGMGKISKSRGGGPMAPLEMIERYSADAVRYWASSTSPGKDSVISEEKIQTGAKLVTKLWNVARFSERFVEGYQPPVELPALSPADHWILSRLQRLVRRATALFQQYDYAAAKSEVENFFWLELADNYLEMCKQRLYDPGSPQHESARFTLYTVLIHMVKLFAPFLPFVTEEIYQDLFAAGVGAAASVHLSSWPVPNPALEDEAAEELGEKLVAVATAVRRYKSDHNLSLGTELPGLQLMPERDGLAQALEAAKEDLASITRAQKIEVVSQLDPGCVVLITEGPVKAALGE